MRHSFLLSGAGKLRYQGEALAPLTVEIDYVISAWWEEAGELCAAGSAVGPMDHLQAAHACEQAELDLETGETVHLTFIECDEYGSSFVVRDLPQTLTLTAAGPHHV